jgi:hypothetical protein
MRWHGEAAAVEGDPARHECIGPDRASCRLAGKPACYETVAVGTVAPGVRPAGLTVKRATTPSVRR